MVKDPVVAEAELVDAFGETMWVSEIAALRPWFSIFWVLAKASGSAKPGEPPGRNDGCLIVAEARKQGVLTGKVVIQPYVELPLVELLCRSANEVSASECRSRWGEDRGQSFAERWG